MEFFTLLDIAKILKLHPQTIRRFIKEGKIFSTKIGEGKRSRHRISKSELERIQLKGMYSKK